MMFTKREEGYFSKKRKIFKAQETLRLPLRHMFTGADVRRQFAKFAREGHPDASGSPDKTIDLNKLCRAKDTLLRFLKDEKDG